MHQNHSELNKDKIIELCCSVDDMTGENIAYAVEKLVSAGAADVCWMPVGMKKGRPGIMLIVVCSLQKREEILHLLFKHTSTIGVRETLCRRHILRSTIETKDTPYGPIRVKSSSGYGVERCKAEYEDLKHIADEYDLTLNEVKNCLSE